MWIRILTVLVMSLSAALPAAWAQPRRSPESTRTASIDRLTRALAQELDYLQEDVYYDRPGDADRWEGRLEEAAQAVIHFQRVLQKGADEAHLLRDYREMDGKIHRLLERLAESPTSRVRRAAERIRYADEQLHYRLAPQERDTGDTFRQLVTRHARVLEEESARLRQAAQYESRRGGRAAGLDKSTQAFAEEVHHFRESAERGADRNHLHKDFAQIDSTWNALVGQINRSDAGIYMRRSAQRVNEVHNQLYDLIAGAGEPPRTAPPRTGPPPTPQPQPEPSRRRPQIEFEIPGLGRFQLR